MEPPDEFREAGVLMQSLPEKAENVPAGIPEVLRGEPQRRQEEGQVAFVGTVGQTE